MSIPTLVPGDWNLSAVQVELIARQLGGELVHGHGVDHVVVAGELRVLSVHRLAGHGSDHRALLVTVELRGGERIRLLWWNVHVRQPPGTVLAAVQQLLDQHRPDVVALAEAYRCRAVLGQLSGYRRLQGRRGEAANLAVLVNRATIKVRGYRRMRLRTRWTGPVHGWEKAPRQFPRVQLRTRAGRARFRLLAVHLPTGGYTGRNRDAVTEAVARIIRWAKR